VKPSLEALWLVKGGIAGAVNGLAEQVKRWTDGRVHAKAQRTPRTQRRLVKAALSSREVGRGVAFELYGSPHHAGKKRALTE